MDQGCRKQRSTNLGSVLTVLGLLLLCTTLVAGCGSDDAQAPPRAKNTMSLDVDDTLADTTYNLINQDTSRIRFPQRFLGRPIVLGTIYTHCPNVCPKITANMKTVRDRLSDPSRVQFVSITFDPERDTPARLASYARRFGVANTSWQFLTGDSTTIARVMNRLDIRYRRTENEPSGSPADTPSGYTFAHSNQITLIDGQGRVRSEYSGSQTPPDLIVEDLQQIQK